MDIKRYCHSMRLRLALIVLASIPACQAPLHKQDLTPVRRIGLITYAPCRMGHVQTAEGVFDMFWGKPSDFFMTLKDMRKYGGAPDVGEPFGFRVASTSAIEDFCLPDVVSERGVAELRTATRCEVVRLPPPGPPPLTRSYQSVRGGGKRSIATWFDKQGIPPIDGAKLRSYYRACAKGSDCDLVVGLYLTGLHTRAYGGLLYFIQARCLLSLEVANGRTGDVLWLKDRDIRKFMGLADVSEDKMLALRASLEPLVRQATHELIVDAGFPLLQSGGRR